MDEHAHHGSTVHPQFLDQPTDELLESIWVLREAGEPTLAALRERHPDPEAETLLNAMAASGLVHLVRGRWELSPAGDARARALVRCHRLAERLLHDALGLPASESEATACLMEHVLSPAVADAVCAFLGHPPTSPGGLPIPGGDCCQERDKEVQPLVLPLADLELGKLARIVFMAQRSHKRVDRLGSYGVVPGSRVRLRQRRPSYVVEIEGTSLAIDAEVAREIYVRREG
jgi:DtxR family Mn-dependent transcriptional regulator